MFPSLSTDILFGEGSLDSGVTWEICWRLTLINFAFFWWLGLEGGGEWVVSAGLGQKHCVLTGKVPVMEKPQWSLGRPQVKPLGPGSEVWQAGRDCMKSHVQPVTEADCHVSGWLVTNRVHWASASHPPHTPQAIKNFPIPHSKIKTFSTKPKPQKL